MATLIYLERHDSTEIEKLTCTDIEQRWGALKESTLNQFEGVPFKEFCHVLKPKEQFKKGINEVTPDLEKKFRALFIKDQPTSEISIFMSGVREQVDRQEPVPSTGMLPKIISHALASTSYVLKRTGELCEALYAECSTAEQNHYKEFICIGDQDSLRMCSETIGQDSEFWELYRFGRITGSICYSLFTYSKNKNPKWVNKLESIFKSSFSGNEDTERGLAYENDARECYVKKFAGSQLFSPGILVHPLVPWLGYSADGIICCAGEPVKVWENKTPRCGRNHGEATIYKEVNCMNKNRGWKLKEKHPYYGQIQLGMLLYSLPTCDFSLYSFGSDEIYVQSVQFDEGFCLTMMETLAQVYFKRVLPWLCDQNSVVTLQN